MDFGIGPLQRLLLTAAFSLETSSAAAALDEWWSRVGNFDLVRGTDAALFPQIYRRLGANIRNPQLAARLKGAARHHWVLNQRLIGHCGKLVNLLISANIPVLLLKGAAISTLVDEDSGLRAMSDWDALVPRNKISEVLRLLAAAGVDGPQNFTESDLDSAGSAPLLDRETGRASFDLHWRPLRTIGADELATEMFMSGREIRVAGKPCMACCPEHIVFHVIVNGAEWSPYPRYDWLVDTIKVLRRFGPEFDWQKLADLACRYRYRFLIGAALEEAGRTPGVTVPDWVLKRLCGRPAPLERWEARLARANPTSLSLAADVFSLFQQLRRGDLASLQRPAYRLLPDLYRYFFGRRPTDRAAQPVQRVEFLQGWSGLEREGRWTNSRFAFLAIHAAPTRRPTTVSVRATTMPNAMDIEQSVTVFAGFERLATLRWSKQRGNYHAQEIRIPAHVWRGGMVILRLHIHSRRTPIEEGINFDTRGLGICLHHLAIEPAVRDLVAKPLELSGESVDADVLWHGWSGPESNGCWTMGRLAVLRWRAARDMTSAVVELEGVHAAPGRRPVRGRLTINNGSARRFKISTKPGRTALQIPFASAIAAGEAVELRIEIDNPRAPSRTGLTDDNRPLGLSIRRVRLHQIAPG